MFECLEKMMETHKNCDDYVENGVLMCGNCHTPKQVLMTLPMLTGDDTPHALPIACACERAASEKAQERAETTRFLARMNKTWMDGVHDPSIMRFTFSDDDGGQAAVTKTCRRYVEKWDDMLKNGIGILFYGPVGTGKTFAASCICNELLQQRVPVCATSFSRIMNKLQSTFEKQDVLDKLGRFSLLVLDDLGSERNTSFASEQIFSVVDSRYRSKRPVIITTNLTLAEIEKPQDLAYSRIYDRVLEMCPIRLCVTGTSRRKGIADERRKLARELLL